MGARVHRVQLGDLMSTEVQTLQKTFEALFPHLTDQARGQLAREVVALVTKSTEQGWDLAAITLLTRGARRTPIGTTLQNLRIRAGLTQEQATAKTVRLTRSAPWHGSKITRIESGRVPISFSDLQFLLHLYGVRDQATIDGLWAIAQQSQQPRRPARRAS